MFTGIVRAMGVVRSIRHHAGGGVMTVHLAALGEANPPLQIGDSVAVNGACLTLAALRDGEARFDVSPETLARCLMGDWQVGQRLNLEPALTLATPLGGHLSAGHIDGIARLLERAPSADFTRLRFAVRRPLGRLLAHKGSVAVDGVSLTINAVSDVADETHFEVMLVPHTLRATTLGALQPGARAHLEADAVARYVQRLFDSQPGQLAAPADSHA